MGQDRLGIVGSVGDLVEQRGDLVWIEVALLGLRLGLLQRIGSGLLWVLCRLVVLLLSVRLGRNRVIGLVLLVLGFVVQRRRLLGRLGFLCGFRLPLVRRCRRDLGRLYR